MVSIIVLSWNAKDLIVPCIDSLLNTIKTTDYEIIVIENGSTDGSAQLLQHHYKDVAQVKLILNAENKGYAGGNNQAWEIAKGEYVLLLNQDTIMPTGTIDGMYAWMNNQPSYAGATVTLKFPDGRLQYYMHRRFPQFFCLVGAFIHKRWPSFAPQSVKRYLYLDKTFQEDFDIEQAAGTCIMLRRKSIEQLGYLFDAKHFPLYYNDVDLCFRIHHAGWKLRCLTNLSLVHYKGTSVRKIPKLRNSWIYLKAVWYYGVVLGRFFTKSAAVK